MFHVTTKDSVASIWNRGIRPQQPSSEWKRQRRAFRQHVDEIGRQEHSEWTNREGAIFFWSRYDDAIQYSKRTGNSVIVEVTSLPSDSWMVNNQLTEQLFEEWMNSEQEPPESERFETLISDFRESAYPYDQHGDSGYETWTQTPIPPDKVMRITSPDGEPLEIL